MSERRGDVLITSGGRRVQLVRFFQEAMRRLDLPGRVLVSDANPEWSAAARVAGLRTVSDLDVAKQTIEDGLPAWSGRSSPARDQGR